MDSPTAFKNQDTTSSEDSIWSNDSKPIPEECTALLNNAAAAAAAAAEKNKDENFTLIELEVLKENRENSPGGVSCGRLEKHDTDMECRICRCKDEEPLISPCKCSGSAKWIHRSCLIQWFQVSRATRCELCSEKVVVRKYTKPIREWKRPNGSFGPCSKVDLWYLFVTLFSLATIVGFAIFQGCMGPDESTETVVVFVAIYILCALMIIVRIRYFYVWFTRRSTYWNTWRSLNQNWVIKSASSVSAVDARSDVV